MSSVETGHIVAVETGQIFAAGTGQMSAVETRQMYSIGHAAKISMLRLNIGSGMLSSCMLSIGLGPKC